MPLMYVPMPTSLPGWMPILFGVVGLIAPLIVAIAVVGRSDSDDTGKRPDIRVPLAGMLGAGLLQVVLVAFGFFPKWGTTPNHLCAFWLLTVLAVSVLLSQWTSRIKGVVVALALFGMVGMQLLYTWHCYRILPRVNTSYIASRSPDLVCLDNLARGYLLQVTDVMAPQQLVLALSSEDLALQLSNGKLIQYRRILYLPMAETVKDGKPDVLAAARSAGLEVTELPVVHTGTYEAIELESTAPSHGTVE